ERVKYILGPKDTPSPTFAFHRFLKSTFGEIPLSAQWLLVIENLPNILDFSLSERFIGLESNKWNTGTEAAAINKAIREGVYLDSSVCVYAQGIETPKESINIERITPSSGFHG